MEQYKRMNEAGQVPEGMMTPQEIMAQQALQGSAGQIGTVIGKPIGDALLNPVYSDMNIGEKLIQGTKIFILTHHNEHYKRQLIFLVIK